MQTEAQALPNVNPGLTAYSTAGTVLVAVLLLSNWPSYNYLIHGGTELIWFHLLPGLLIIPIVFAQPSMTFRFTRDPLLWWLLVFVISGVLWLMLSQDFIESAATQWRTRLLAFGLFFTITILSSEANRKVLGIIIVACVLFACATTWFDVLRPHRFVPSSNEYSVSGRGAGFFVNPNVAGSFLALATIAALPFIPMRLRALFIVAAIVGIVPTLSRSAFVYAAMIIIGAVVLRLVNRSQALLLITGVPLLIAAGAVSYDFLMSASDDANLHNVVKRLEFFSGEEEDDAVEGRRYGAAQAWKLFLDAPMTGRGIGITTMQAIVGEGPHNMYLMLMAEQGFFGLALYPALILIIGAKGRRLARSALTQEGFETGQAMMLYAAVLFAYGFFSHNVLEEPQTLFTLAFMAAAAMSVPRAMTFEQSVVTDFQRAPAGPIRPRLGRL